MPFARPTLRTLIDRAIADINARLPDADARLPFSNLNVLSYVIGGATHGLYGFLDWIARQVFPDSAEEEYLQRWGTIWGVTRKAAAPATGSVTLTGTAGAMVPTGTLLQRPDGQQYQTTADATLAGGSVNAAVVAVTAGEASSCDAGVSLSLVSPVAGVNSSGVVASGGLTGGADIETDDALRARLLARIQQPPHGGSANDYVTWALEVAGVTRAWVYPQELGLGTVTVRFVRDNDGTGADIIPGAAEVAAVQAYIDARRPVTADVTVVAPNPVPLNFQIQGLTPNTAAVQSAVQTELQDLLLREAVPGGTILLSHIRAAISAAAGETDYMLLSPSANVTNTTGNMSTMGTITWS
ncbi:baseplate J/gp47 family protein [Rhodocyclus purpureus]|uniref:baseplate J/gp47 family protein n=1 Tax=Rhodocyclus purpureus TaxID=1067 RepID=UPI00191472CC|nr:baseplate J/gp47 family protein [Rhodocyclus purpureus]MBK5914570.1 baseplate J protein [Rhodocyclus purpureus]